MNARAKSLARAMVAAAAVLLLASTAAAADDVLTPERRTLLDPANHPGATLQQQDAWQVSAVRTGAVPGLPGNRHNLLLSLHRSAGHGDEDIVAPRVGVTLTSSQCEADGTTCTRLLRVEGSVLRPPGLVTVPDGPASATGVVIDPRGPGWRVEAAPGTPVGPWTADLTITPSGPPLGSGVTFDSAEWISYSRNGDAPAPYFARNQPRSGPATVRGTALGITFGAGDTATVSRWEQLYEPLPVTPPVRTAAERRPYLPGVANGAVVEGSVSVSASGTLARQPVTSTGRVFPGNRTVLQLSLLAEPGASSAGASVLSLQCAAPGTPTAECETVDGVRLTENAPPALVAGPDGRVAATRSYAVAPEATADDDPDAWGTIRLAVVAAPGASGELTQALTYFRTGGTASLSGGTVLSYGTPARPPVVAATLGTAALRAPDPAAGQSSEIRYVRSFFGTVPAPSR